MTPKIRTSEARQLRMRQTRTTPKSGTLQLVVMIAGALWISSAAPQAQDVPSAPPEMPPARAIPGIIADDQFPNACVDCHIYYPDMNLDTRISTLMARWVEAVDPVLLDAAQAVAGSGLELAGVHPRVDASLEDIPAACLNCHESGSRAVVRLVPLLHKIHFDAQGEAVFLKLFQGECTHCHKLDRITGEWRVPSRPES